MIRQLVKWPHRLLVLACCLTAGAAQASQVTVFAAASTTDPLNQVIQNYQTAGGGEVRAVVAASSTLAKQIEQGAPADIYLAANAQWMAYLAEQGLIDRESRVDFLSNRLMLIGSEEVTPARQDAASAVAEMVSALTESERDLRLAMGDPGHVPAGIYAKTALEQLGVWSALTPHLALAGDARRTLALVQRGEAAYGIVYASDALGATHLQILAELPLDENTAITYPIAVVSGRTDPAVRDFFDYLTGPDGQAVFADFGFQPQGL